MSDFEKLGAFYLGRRFDPTDGLTQETTLYDAKDLTTHALCVGMTGSGKTGLGVALLEEAAIDGIPSIVIDPKGDMGNLLLTFPDLKPASFEPWIDEGDAARKGRTVPEHAKWTADLWRNGLGEWGQGPERIKSYANAAERVIYTPGSTAGRPVTVLRSFAAPPPEVVEDTDAMRDRIMGAVGGLLALLGIDADPLRSREHILLSTILNHAWSEGRDLDLPSLIREIQSPPVERIGVFDLDTFYPDDDRLELAMTLNNVLASPGFGAWMEGEPLDIQKILYGEGGKPRVAIFSIAHLSDTERMFFVTMLLNEFLTWMRRQPGSRTLRALLYMDEIFGYFPPSKNPPSKGPMLTLLKQARAFGCGIVLATQNPVDLDYKGLANCGTWFIGRLQTERDKMRVIDGLEGASVAAGGAFDRAAMDRLLSGLESRVFLLNNVHEDGPVLFHTRWVLSYLSGPLTRAQIETLNAGYKPPKATVAEKKAARSAGKPAKTSAIAPDPSVRPILDDAIPEAFLPAALPAKAGESLRYVPMLVAETTVHFAKTTLDVDEWRSLLVVAPLDDPTNPWEDADVFVANPTLEDEPAVDADFAELPKEATKASKYKTWNSKLKTHLYRTRRVRIWQCKKPKLVSVIGESEDAFRGRLESVLREERDLEVEKLRARYAPKLKRLEDRVERAAQRLEKEEEQLKYQKSSAVIQVGATVLGALFGRKKVSATNVRRAGSAVRGAGRISKDKGDVDRARETLEELRVDFEALEAEAREAIAELQDAPSDAAVKEVEIPPRKSDIAVDELALAWMPMWVGGEKPRRAHETWPNADGENV
jgi:hypothetical protein